PGVRARVEARIKRRLALQRLLEIANPTADSAPAADANANSIAESATAAHANANPTAVSADTDTKDTGEGASDQRALQEAAQSYANALSSVEQHPGEEEI